MVSCPRTVPNEFIKRILGNIFEVLGRSDDIISPHRSCDDSLNALEGLPSGENIQLILQECGVDSGCVEWIVALDGDGTT
jgi:hypothetical protein